MRTLIPAMFGTLALASAAAHAAPPTRSQLNGSAATAFSYSELESFNLDVWQNSSRTTDQTVVNYSRWAADPDSQVCQTEVWWPCDPAEASCVPEEYTYCYYSRTTYWYGWAELDAEAFQANPQAAALHATIDSARGYTETCTSDSVAGTFECTSGAAVRLDFDWSRTSEGSGQNSGRYEFRAGKYRTMQVGTTKWTTARFQGEIDGFALKGEGRLLQGRGVQIERAPAL